MIRPVKCNSQQYQGDSQEALHHRVWGDGLGILATIAILKAPTTHGVIPETCNGVASGQANLRTTLKSHDFGVASCFVVTVPILLDEDPTFWHRCLLMDTLHHRVW